MAVVFQEVCENSPKAARTPSEHPKPVTAHALGTQETRGNANSATSTTFCTFLQLKRAGVRHAATHPRPRTRNGTVDYTTFDDALWWAASKAAFLRFLRLCFCVRSIPVSGEVARRDIARRHVGALTGETE